MRYIIKDRNLLLLFIVSFLFFLNETILLPVLPLVLADLGYSNTRIGMTLGAFALGVLVFRPLTAYVTDNKSRKLSLLIGTFVFLAAPFLYFVSMDFYYLMGVRFFHGLGISFFTTASPAFVADLAPEEHRGEILGHMGIAASLASVLGPLLGIFIYNTGGIPPVLWGCILLGVLGFGLTGMIREGRAGRPGKTTAGAYTGMLGNRGVMAASGLVLVLAMMSGGI
ncbi:MAG: MFS transporter, partial [Desulfobacterales bacterium]|nr:MFS transporter [Desulfobacterales bacterium]